MATQIPILAAHCDTRLRTLLAILAAGGSRDNELEVVGYVRSDHAHREVKDGHLRAMRDSDGEVVCYKQMRPKVERDAKGVLPAENWQKTPSGAVTAMQLKIGQRGRVIPAYQRSGAICAEMR